MTTKVNPTKANTVDHFNGKTVTAVTVDFAVNGTDFSDTEMGALGAVQEAILTLSNQATPIIITKLRSDGSNDGQVFDVIYEGEFGTDTYDGSTSESFADYLQSELRLLTAAGSNDINLGSATVVAGTAVNFS
jgi:hypothetical protein